MNKKPFIPTLLPISLKNQYTQEFANQLAKAESMIGRLDGLATILPNPELLIAPFLKIEAVNSSKIEGTQASLDDVYKGEANLRIAPRKQDEVKEISNYIQAMNRGLDLCKNEPLNLDVIKKIHFTLLQGVRGEEKQPGKFRKRQNWIGNLNTPIENAIFVPPPPKALPNLLKNLEYYILNDEMNKNLLIQCGILHYQFEAIHPFLDGNGRVGRLIIALFFHNREIIIYPLLYPSEYFENHREEYYQHLLRVSEQGEWIPWLTFFLKALTIQAKKARDCAEKILILYKQSQSSVALNIHSRNGIKLINHVFQYPYTTAKRTSVILGVSHQTAIRLLVGLVDLGIIRGPIKFKKSKSNIFIFDNLLKILQYKSY